MSIRHIFPSAGLMILFLIFGVVLSGSLKNQIIKNVNKKPIVARGRYIKSRTKEIIKEIDANFQPSL